MALTTMQQVLDAMPGQVFETSKGGVNSVTNGFASHWASTGLPPAGAIPSSGLAGDVPTSATTGALQFVNPASGTTNIARAFFSGNNPSIGAAGAMLIYDRLWQNSGIDATSTGAQTINSVALTRPDANGANVEAWWQVYAAMGAGTPTVTLSYTDQDGNAGASATSGALAATMALGRTGPFQLASGDTGVRSIQSWTANATFTSGTIDLVLRRLIAVIPFPNPPHPNYDAIIDVLGGCMAQIPDNACVEFMYLAPSATTIVPCGQIQLVQG